MKKGWEPARIGDLLTIQNGFAFDSKSFSESRGVPLIRIRDLKDGQKTETKYDGSFDKRYEVRSGDFLIGMDGEFGCYEWRGGKALLNQRVCRLEGFSEKLEPRFLFYGINKYLKEIEHATTYTTVKHLSSKQISNIEVPLPPRSEQKRIVAILDEAFAGLATATVNAEKNLKNARELFDNCLNAKFDQPGERWTTCRLGDLSSIGYGYTQSASQKEIGPKFLRITDIQNSSVDWDGVPFCAISVEDLRKFRLESGDIVFARTGATTGKSYIVTDPPKAVFASYLIRVRPAADIVSSLFLNLFFQSRTYWDQINVGISGSAQGGFNATKLANLIVAFPQSLVTQDAIVSRLFELSTQTTTLAAIYRSKLDKLGHLKQSILSAAFSGELTSPPSSAIKEAAE